MSEHIVPVWDRVEKTSRIARMQVEVERCAALTLKGEQCTSGLWGGEGGGHRYIDGLRVPLCTVHLRKANLEDW